MGRIMPTRVSALAGGLLIGLPIVLWAACGSAQEPLPWQRPGDPRYQQSDDTYRPPYDSPRYDDPRWNGGAGDAGTTNRDRPNDAYSPRNGAPKLFERDANAPRYGSPAPAAN